MNIYKVAEIPLPLGAQPEQLRRLAAGRLRVSPERIASLELTRRSFVRLSVPLTVRRFVPWDRKFPARNRSATNCRRPIPWIRVLLWWGWVRRDFLLL